VTSPSIEAFHLAAPDGGYRFCVLRRPAQGLAPRGAILHLPAFGEEMNKARHMVALQAQRLAADGWLVLQIDLLGTGDSSGELAEAGWQDWLADVRLAVDWLRAQQAGPVWLWGLRLGGLLAAEAERVVDLDCGLLLWQPVSSGRQHLQQILRLWKMARVVGKAVETALSPQQRLDAGEVVEVAGYAISPALAAGMQAASLAAPERGPGLCWLQVGAAEPPAAFLRVDAACRAAGRSARFHAVEGSSFWQTQEIAVVPALIEHTTRLMALRDAAPVLS
jgi:exosortase A-associated hydrolase 2